MSVLEVEPPVFGLADIPDNWEIALNQDFLDSLDRINRPWKYDPDWKGRRVATYWDAGTAQKRTIENMSPERFQDYTENVAFVERLWGRHRFKDYHFEEGDPRRYVDTGSWILKSQINVLRKGIKIEDSELEKVIVGLRMGKANYPREIKFPKLPLVADKWWAWLLGYYFSTGSIGFREPMPQKRMKREGIYVHLRAYEPVIPLVMRVTSKIGITPKIRDVAQQKTVLPLNRAKGLRTTRRRELRLGWPEYIVLVKFGLPTDFLKDDVGMVSRSYKPKIPKWIKDVESCMQAFFEGYINGSRGSSYLGKGRIKRRHQPQVRFRVLIKVRGGPEEYVLNFVQDIVNWLERQNLRIRYRKIEWDGVPSNQVEYSIEFGHREGARWLLENFEIARPDLRARIVARLEAYQDRVLNEALLQLYTPANVVLGLLLERPATSDEIYHTFQMRREGVKACLQTLRMKGLVTKRGDYYVYAPDEFARRLIKEKEELAEVLTSRMNRYATKLLYQCSDCKRVYVVSRETCGLCGADISPTERNSILRSLDVQRSFAKKIGHEIGEMVA